MFLFGSVGRCVGFGSISFPPVSLLGAFWLGIRSAGHAEVFLFSSLFRCVLMLFLSLSGLFFFFFPSFFFASLLPSFGRIPMAGSPRIDMNVACEDCDILGKSGERKRAKTRWKACLF